MPGSRSWLSRPWQGVKLDPTCKLNDRLCIAWSPVQAGTQYDLLGNKINAGSTVASLVNSPYGPAVKFTDINPYTTIVPPISKSVTVATLCYVDASTGTGSAFGVGHVSPLGCRFACFLPYSGVVEWDFGDKNTVGAITWTPPSGFWQTWHTMVFRGGYSGLQIWSDGILKASATDVVSIDSPTESFLFNSGYGDPPGGESVGFAQFLMASREWSSDEIRSWSRNPWQIYAPKADYWLFKSVASFSGSVTLEATGDVTASGLAYYVGMSSYLEEKLLNHVFGVSPYTQPTAWYVKLHTDLPSRNGVTNAAGNTTRAQITSWNTTISPDGTITSSSQIQWTNVSTDETYSHLSIWDHPTAGNCLGTGALTGPVAVLVGNTFVIDSGDLIVALS